MPTSSASALAVLRLITSSTLVACCGLAGSVAARARPQQRGLPVIGYLYGGTPSGDLAVAGFRQGLGEQGYIEGRNVEIQ
jgi:hypothetical protein